MFNPASISFTAAIAAASLSAIARAHHQIGVRLLVFVHEGIAADDGVGMGGGDLPQRAADVAFPRIGADRFGQHAHARFQLGRDDVHHRLHDRGHAGHHDDIADLEAGREDGRALDQFGAVGDAGHAQAGLVEVLLAPALAEPRDHLRVMVDADAERLGDAVGGDVVMGRPDAAGGEDIGVAMPQCIQARR